MTAVLELDPATRPYEPRGGAREIFTCKATDVLYDGPSGTGKTRAVIEKCHLICQTVPHVRILWVRATRASMTQSVLEIFEHKVLPENHFFLNHQSREHRSMYIYPNGSEIVLGGMDKSSRIMSTEYDIIAVFEATEIKQGDWEDLTTRCRNHKLPFQQMVADCNPAHPQHWLWQGQLHGWLHRIRSRHTDNPTVTPEYLARLNNLQGHRRSRLLEGLWVAAEGVVYPDIAECFVEPYEPPAGRLVGGMDFGYTNPFAALAGTVYNDENGNDVLYIWYERYKSKTLLSDHAAALPTGHVWWADPSEPGSIIELRKAGHRVHKAKNDIMVGINACTRRIDAGGLHISNKCTALRAEVDAYRYDEAKSSEKPIDEFNHACDAMRYLVMGVDRGRVARQEAA